MIKQAIKTLSAAALMLGLLAVPAQAAPFGFQDLDVTFTDAEGTPAQAMRAGSHPFEYTTRIDLKSEEDPELGKVPAGGQVREISGEFPPGLVGNPFAVPPCSGVDFATIVGSEPGLPVCGDGSVVGYAQIVAEAPAVNTITVPVYNLTPPPGAAAKLGFVAVGQPATIIVGAHDTYPYNLHFSVPNITQTVRFYESELTIWGNPSSSAHDEQRGPCGAYWFVGPEKEEGGKFLPEGATCPTTNPDEPFLTMPRSCEGPLSFSFAARTWDSGESAAGSVTTHDEGEPLGLHGCEELDFGPSIDAAPTSPRASSASGLDFALNVDAPGLVAPEGRADADIKTAQVTLPAGVRINPSQAEGLGTCSESQLESEKADSAFGAGCPAASRIGSVEVETPLLKNRTLKGSLFVAEPYENRFDSLIALYMVIREPRLGLVFKLAGKVEPTDQTGPEAGRLVTTFDQLPPYPFEEFRLRFREGARSPLITPPACGTYTTEARFTSTAGQSHETDAQFEITEGVGGGACPPGRPPFEPGFDAGSINNSAGAYSPFQMRLTRSDGEQDIVKFSAKLPPGVLARLAGVTRCPEDQIAAAEQKTGKAERRSQSCPFNSQIGTTLAGAGVGSQLTYVPGKLYLAGPYKGAPLSVVAVTPAVAGPFDVGTVVVRVGLNVNPITGAAETDGSASDPIPHLLEGIPLSLRELRVNVDRSGFTLNPTDCRPTETTATIFGGGTELDPSDDSPVSLASRYQAADCAALDFTPRLGIRLFGGVRRGAFPALRAAVVPPPGQANFSRAVVILPSSAFIEQGHFGNVCTRVQFAAGAGHGAQCPPRSRYGVARAFSPLLDGPAQGPVFLRSSDNELPDLVVALTGPDSAPVDVELSARIDSVRSRLRATFAGIPDIPVSRFVLAMQGGQKGLIVNSRHLCFKPTRNRANANLRGQNAKLHRIKPRVISVACAKRRQARRAKNRAAQQRQAQRARRSAARRAAQRG